MLCVCDALPQDAYTLLKNLSFCLRESLLAVQYLTVSLRQLDPGDVDGIVPVSTLVPPEPLKEFVLVRLLPLPLSLSYAFWIVPTSPRRSDRLCMELLVSACIHSSRLSVALLHVQGVCRGLVGSLQVLSVPEELREDLIVLLLECVLFEELHPVVTTIFDRNEIFRAVISIARHSAESPRHLLFITSTIQVCVARVCVCRSTGPHLSFLSLYPRCGSHPLPATFPAVETAAAVVLPAQHLGWALPARLHAAHGNVLCNTDLQRGTLRLVVHTHVNHRLCWPCQSGHDLLPKLSPPTAVHDTIHLQQGQPAFGLSIV